jgi:hypothetical protein
MILTWKHGSKTDNNRYRSAFSRKGQVEDSFRQWEVVEPTKNSGDFNRRNHRWWVTICINMKQENRNTVFVVRNYNFPSQTVKNCVLRPCRNKEFISYLKVLNTESPNLFWKLNLWAFLISSRRITMGFFIIGSLDLWIFVGFGSFTCDTHVTH